MSNNITITIENPTPLTLFAISLAQPLESGAVQLNSIKDLAEKFSEFGCPGSEGCTGCERGADSDDAPAQDQPVSQPTPAPELKPIRKPADLLSLEPGDLIHWKGARFEFDGEVVEVNVDEGHFDEDDSLIYDDEEIVLYVRRSDTGKRVSLTWADLQTHSLTLR